MLIYKQTGMELAPENQRRLGEIYQKLGPLSLAFTQAINDDQKEIVLSAEELAGTHELFLKSFPEAEPGHYRVTLHHPAYMHIMSFCSVESTRALAWNAYHNRAYPSNAVRLEQIRALRQESASILGSTNFATFDIAQQMAKSPATVHSFLDDLLIEFQKKS